MGAAVFLSLPPLPPLLLRLACASLPPAPSMAPLLSDPTDWALLPGSTLSSCSWDDWKKQQDEAAAREAAMEAANAQADREFGVGCPTALHAVLPQLPQGCVAACFCLLSAWRLCVLPTLRFRQGSAGMRWRHAGCLPDPAGLHSCLLSFDLTCCLATQLLYAMLNLNACRRVQGGAGGGAGAAAGVHQGAPPLPLPRCWWDQPSCWWQRG